MKEFIGDVSLKNRVSGQFEPARLFRGIDDQNLSCIDQKWTPLFERRLIEIGITGESRSDINAEDAHWKWGEKALAGISDPLLYDIFTLECSEDTQALMLVKKGGIGCFSRHPEHVGAQLIYVDFLATAPWNRKRMVDKPIYKGCGRVLISTAISLSIEEELEGRIGLHSLPGAESFYRDQMHFSDLGKDENYHRLHYFELSSSKAKDFFSETT
jgi:hypothetical protein